MTNINLSTSPQLYCSEGSPILATFFWDTEAHMLPAELSKLQVALENGQTRIVLDLIREIPLHSDYSAEDLHNDLIDLEKSSLFGNQGLIATNPDSLVYRLIEQKRRESTVEP